MSFATTHRPAAHRRRRILVAWRTQGPRLWWVNLAAILTVAMISRFASLPSRPGWEWDEPVYTSVARSVANGTGIRAIMQFDASPEPYLYHPPFYFLLLGGWFKIFGSGITEARYFAATASVLYIGILAVAVRRLASPRAGLIAAVLLSFDSWLMFENRISWIDNSLMVLYALSVLAFAVAFERGRERDWLALGAALGGTILYKHIGASVILGFALTFFLLRHRIADLKRALFLVGMTVVTMCVLYVCVMVLIWPDDYLRENLDQVLRSTGAHSSNGTVHLTVASLLQALRSKYWLYVGTAASVGVATVVGGRRIWRRATEDESLVLWALGVGCAAFLTVLSIRFPHYTILVFVPMLCYLAVVVDDALWRAGKRRTLLYGLLAVLLVVNGVGATVRMTWHPDNTLREATTWLEQHATQGETVIADEPVGAVIDSPYCRITSSPGRCSRSWKWIITYTSLTQKLPTRPQFRQLLDGSDRCVTFEGFKENVSIYARGSGTCP